MARPLAQVVAAPTAVCSRNFAAGVFRCNPGLSSMPLPPPAPPTLCVLTLAAGEVGSREDGRASSCASCAAVLVRVLQRNRTRGRKGERDRERETELYFKEFVTEQDPMGPSENRTTPPPRSSTCLLSGVNFSQRINLIREVRKCREKGKQSSKTKS